MTSPAPCPACRTPSGDAGAVRTCEACGLRFAWPMVAGDAAWYASSGVYDGDGAPRVPDARHRACFARVEVGSLLDLGCGDGAFLRFARDRGFVVRGVEFQADLARRAREAGFDVQHADLVRALEDDAPRVDLVTAFDVLEHLDDPAAIARGLLARGHTAVVSVPSAERRPAVFDPVVDAPPHHLTLWTRAALRELFRRAGARHVDVVELPLTADELFLHHLWRRHGHGAIRTDRFDGLVKRSLGPRVLLRRALGLARGHTLMAFAS